MRTEAGVPEEFKQSVKFMEYPLPRSLDYVAFGYPVLVLILAYGALVFKDQIVNEEAYDKFHERIEWMSRQTAITSQLLLSEIFKHFPVLAFTTLSMFYLIKPIKGSSSAVGRLSHLQEKAIVKKHNDILAKLKNEKQSITPEMERRLDALVADRTSMKLSRFMEYNSLMVQINKFCLSLDLQLSIFSYLIFLSQRVGLYSSPTVPVLIILPILLFLLRRHDGWAASLEAGLLLAGQLPFRRLQVQKDHARVIFRSLHARKDL
jgi:hypothetical protein